MSDRFFLDTNIFVYASDGTSPAKAKRAEALMREAVTTQKGVVSYQVVQEFFNLALRRFSQPMTLTEAEQYLQAIFSPLLAIHSSSALYAEALHIQQRYRLSWYDTLIVAAAAEAECRILYSEDFQDGQRFGQIRVKNPFV
jgi:predicted nucleic acid-binding protein